MATATLTNKMTARTSTQALYHTKTGTVSYVVWDSATRYAAVIDPVLDFDLRCERRSRPAPG